MTFTCGCYRSVRQDSCRADIRMCSHCLFPVVATSLEQVVLTLAQGCWRVTDLLQVVPTRPIQTVRNKFLRACCHQPVNRDLKQTGRQRDDDGYSHNDIPDLVQKKWIIKSPTRVRGVVLGLFTTANQRFSRLVYNVNMPRRDKWNYKCAQQKRF